MKLFIALISMTSLALLGIYLFGKRTFLPGTSANIMMNQSIAICDLPPIQTQLRIWSDPIHRSSNSHGALPPGVEAPPPLPQGPETHALHLELSVINTSQKQQTVHVEGWSWSQGNQTVKASWNIQPDMSPLNRYNQVQRHLVELQENQLVKANIDLAINGRSCHLYAQTQA